MVRLSRSRTYSGHGRKANCILPVVLAVLVPSQAFSASHQSSAGSSSCASTNGQTVCLQGSGSLSCTAVDGSTRCEGSDGMLCEEDADGVLTCTPPAGGRCETTGNQIVCVREAG